AVDEHAVFVREGRRRADSKTARLNGMTTIESAWRAFLAAIEEAKTSHAAGASVSVVRDLLQYARELLETIDDEIALNGISVPAEVRSGLEQLRAQLAAAESGLVTRH